MGLLDNTLQIESTKVVNVSNCSNSEGEIGRYSMENDYCDVRSSLPNYKRRSISAVRDFPPGFGRHEAISRNHSLPPKYPSQRKISAVRDFPPFCGRYQDTIGIHFKNEMELTQPDLLEQSSNRQERVQIQREMKTQAALETGKRKEGSENVSSPLVKANRTDIYNYKRVHMKEQKKKKKMKNSSPDNLHLVNRSRNVDANDSCDARSKVRETLRLFQDVFTKLVKEDETNSKSMKRPDLAAAGLLKDKYINLGKIIGPVPGIEIGDEFQYRVELNIIGLHRQIQGGIDYVKHNGAVIATSVVASGGYDDNTDDPDVLIYTGSGGNMMNGKKEPEDQKLERGNLALRNSVDAKNHVRVTRGVLRASESSSGKKMIYVYDGLYLVEKYWQELGPHNKLIYKFRLVRLPGQPQLS